MANTSIEWTSIRDYTDIRYEHSGDGIAKITINRPEVRNAFRPQTLMEISEALVDAREDTSVGVIILTGEGGKAFCSGGDQSVRGVGGYVGSDKVPRLNVLDFQKMIRSIPKAVIAMVAGWCAATPATSPSRAGRAQSAASTSPICISRCAECPNRSLPWWPGTPSEAAMCSTSCAT